MTVHSSTWVPFFGTKVHKDKHACLAWSFVKKLLLQTLIYALRKPTKTRQKNRQKTDKTDKMSVLKIRNSEKPTNVGSENCVSVAILG